LYTTSSADTLYFVAGPSTSSGENLYTVTVSGGQSANSLTFQSSGAPTLSGGTINLWSGGLNLPPFAFGTTPQAPVTISSIIVIQASQIWTNNSSNLLTVSGKINVGANTLTIGGVGNTVLSGVVGSGSGSLVQAGSGSLILTATNNYTGGTTITSGSLQIGDGTSGHDGAIPASGGVSDNMALVYDLYGSQTYSGAISGPGSLIKVGGGSLTLSAATAIAAALQSPPAHWLRPTPARWPATILLAVLR
jgi:autotransporter-associated beta strand protein